MEEFICQNCRKKSEAEGDIPPLLRLPLLFILLYFPSSRKICRECSQQLILIGGLLFPVLIVGILVLAGMLVGKFT